MARGLGYTWFVTNLTGFQTTSITMT